jgi:ABC-2 type transport system ATP-binding protein
MRNDVDGCPTAVTEDPPPWESNAGVAGSGLMALGVGRLLLLTAGRAALQRALPLYVALAIGASIVFGGNGLNPATVAELSARSWPFRVALHLGWALVSLPAVKALLATESTFVFRALPVSRLAWLGWTATLLVVAELPWAVLWLCAAGLVPALAETCWGLAACALVLSRLEAAALLVGAALSVLLLHHPSTPAAVLVALPAAALTSYRVWLRAPELAAARSHNGVRGPAALALALSYLAVLWRTAGAQLLRGLALVVASAGVAALHLRNSGGHARLTTLLILTPALVLALAGVVGPLLRAERDLGWLMACTNVSPMTRQLGTLATLAALSVAAASLGATLIASLLTLAGAERLALFAEVALAAAALAPLVLRVARWAVRDAGRDAARLILGLGAAGTGAVLSIVWMAERSLALWCPIALAALWTARPTGARRAHKTGRSQVLEIDQVRKRLGGKRVLDGVSATCGAGEVLVVLGENGAGKSTLLRIVAGIVEPDAGEVTLCGVALAHGNAEARRQLGYAPDAAQPLPDLRVEELVALVRALKALPRAISGEVERRWWDRLGLELLLGQRLGTLSFGQRKRALTAVAIAGDPWLLVLDEPSNGLDPAGSELMLELIAERRARGLATLLASNDAPFVVRLGGAAHHLRAGKLAKVA